MIRFTAKLGIYFMLLDNTENGFILKSNFELKKAYFLFKIISNRALTNIGKNALELSLKLKLPILFIVKRTVFEQFCSGETLDESIKTVQKLYEKNAVLNIWSIFCFSLKVI